MIALFMLTAAAGLMPPEVLQRRVEAFAGRGAIVDPRLLLPDCAEPVLAMGAGGRSVVVDCAAPAWRVFVPLAGGAGAAGAAGVAARPQLVPEATPVIRRGDRVVVEAGGPGFVIGLEAVADGDSSDGRVALRALGGGRRLSGVVGADGRVRIHGLSAMVNRR